MFLYLSQESQDRALLLEFNESNAKAEESKNKSARDNKRRNNQRRDNKVREAKREGGNQ